MRRKQEGPIQNPAVAEVMAFLDSERFRNMSGVKMYSDRSVRRARMKIHLHSKIGRAYCESLWRAEPAALLNEENRDHPYHVALSVDRRSNLETLTKRTALISDTLVISNDAGEDESPVPRLARRKPGPMPVCRDHNSPEGEDRYVYAEVPHDEIGQWVLGAKPLISSGATWFLPKYYTSTYEGPAHEPEFLRTGAFYGTGEREPHEIHEFSSSGIVDFLVRNGRAVDVSGVNPVKSRMVRPVINMRIPVIEGTSLTNFSKITMDEFGSFSSFRDFLRERLLELDPALNAVDSEVELTRIGLNISDQVRDIDSRLRLVKKKRAVQAAGAAIGSLGAVLLAVYGPALQTVVASIGATGGAWGMLNAFAENSTRPLKDEKWYYVWALAQKAENFR
ncbi:hypothetical protein ACFQLX_16600 [Streptomyces polyrhachis]|uniref:Transmembrane protein n=1 Tax=Streptomyces polyrhachis TaxID=1282885 RepID=A0ABW2GGA7_9ACTN